MTPDDDRGSRGLAGAFGAPPRKADPPTDKNEKKDEKKKRSMPGPAAAAKTTAEGEPAAASRPKRPPRADSQRAKNTAPTTEPVAPSAEEPPRLSPSPPSPAGPRRRRSVRVPVRYLRRCAIVRAHLGLSQGDVVMAAYRDHGEAMLRDAADLVDRWTRRPEMRGTEEGRDNLQPMLTDDERAALDRLVEEIGPAASWPKVTIELLDRHLPALESAITQRT